MRKIKKNLNKIIVSLVCAVLVFGSIFANNLLAAQAATTRYCDVYFSFGSTSSVIRLQFGDTAKAWVYSNKNSVTLKNAAGNTTTTTTAINASRLGTTDWYYVSCTLTIPKGYYFTAGSTTGNFDESSYTIVQTSVPGSQSKPSIITNDGQKTSPSTSDTAYNFGIYWNSSRTDVSTTQGSSYKKFIYGIDSFTVKFYKADKKTLHGSAQTVNYAHSATKPSTNPTKTGYTFSKWDKTYTSVTANMNIYPVFTANTYTVKYNGNGNTGGSTANSSHTYDTAKKLTKNGYTRTGYKFAGWATSSKGAVAYTDQESVKNLTSTAKGTVTLYAVWTAVDYTVSFNANGGTGTMADQTLSYDVAKALSANTFARPTYTFMGWSTDPDAATATYTDKQSVKNLTTPPGTVKLYAVWKKTDASFDTSTLIHDENMFTGDGKLVGGAGTTYDKNNVDSKYAHVDDPGDPGYFTRR